MPSARRGCCTSSRRVCFPGVARLLIIISLLHSSLLALIPGAAAFTMVGAARRKAPAVSAAAVGLHKKTAAAAAAVVRKAANPKQSSSSSEGGLHEKYGSPEIPLRLILVGHNPSAAAWRDGHYYSNSSNRMWKLLGGAGIIPPHYTAKDDDRCPATCGIGFTDLVRSVIERACYERMC